MKLYQHDGKTYKRLRVGQIIKPTDFCNAKTDILFIYREVPNV